MTLDREFARRINDLQLSADMLTPDIVGDRVRQHELESLFSVFLPDATSDEIAELTAIQQDLDSQVLRLETLHGQATIDNEEYAQRVNSEMDLARRRCERILGEQRAAQLFGMESGDRPQFVLADLMETRDDNVRTESRNVGDSVDGLLIRYIPSPDDRPAVVNAIRTIDPQHREKSLVRAWGARHKYAGLVGQIAEAEAAYRDGNVASCLIAADQVVASVSELTEVGDATLYLVGWAHHVQGRAYEARADWRNAGLHYRASLTAKFRINDWLPELSLLVTEVKLGGIEINESPVDAITRLTRVADFLVAQPGLRHHNSRLYSNLLEDSRLTLAEAYVEIGRGLDAAKQARAAMRVARNLRDHIGEIRSIYVLFKASALDNEAALTSIEDLVSKHQGVRKHPRIANILAALGATRLPTLLEE